MPDYFKTLGVSPNDSKEDIKKAYRNLAKKFHPDINKSPEAEKKFKEISEAYRKVEDGNYVDNSQFSQSGFGGSGFTFDSSFFTVHEAKDKIQSDIEHVVDVEFLDACIGGSQNIKYKIKKPCKSCVDHKEKNGSLKMGKCRVCDGSGKVVKKAIQVTITNVCPECNGTGSSFDCDDCSGNLFHDVEKKISISIPEGVGDEAILKLKGCGNYNYDANSYGDLFLHLNVKHHPLFSRRGNDIYSNIEVDYLECILGGDIEVNTIHGTNTLYIEKFCKNGHIIKKDGIGIKKDGDHFFTVSIKIPDSVSEYEKKHLENIKKDRKNDII